MSSEREGSSTSFRLTPPAPAPPAAVYHQDSIQHVRLCGFYDEPRCPAQRALARDLQVPFFFLPDFDVLYDLQENSCVFSTGWRA